MSLEQDERAGKVKMNQTAYDLKNLKNVSNVTELKSFFE